MARKPKSVAELYELHERIAAEAKLLYDQKDAILAKLVRVWKKDKAARIDQKFVLDIEDTWRGKLKAFAPAFSHRYKLKLNPAQESD
jgi:hypothetical protein